MYLIFSWHSKHRKLKNDDTTSSPLTVLTSWDEDGDGDSRRQIKLKSRDYYWYSPILKPQLRGLAADALVLARTEQDVLHTTMAAAKHGVPVTARGAGTGNYGQAVPLEGGIVLDVSGLDEIIDLDEQRGIITVGAGAKLQTVEDEARKHGWELRQHPSTRRQATIGGFVAGGSTGHGGLLHGGLAETGAVLSLRVVVADPDHPRILQLDGPDAVEPVIHAYGTNGIIEQLEVT